MATRLRSMPKRAIWQKPLAQMLGAEAAGLMARAEARYADLYTARQRHAHRALRMHLEKNILPGVALYQTLRADGMDQTDALAVVEAAFRGEFTPKARQTAVLARVPFFWAAFRLIVRAMLRRDFPAEGWENRLVEDSRERLAFETTRCFYLDTLTRCGAPELVPVYCATDDWMMEGWENVVAFERTTTLGRGGDRCDFCYRRVR